MSMRTRLLVFGYPLVEVTTAYLVALWIGWLWMIVLVLAGIPAGLAVMRNAADAAVRDVQRAQSGAVAVDPGRHATAFVAGLLIAIPGLWTDLIGVLLLVAPTRRLFTRRTRAWLDGHVTTVRMPGFDYPTESSGAWSGDVIQGTVITAEDERDQPRPS